MARMTPDQIRTRDRVETVIGLMAPFLNVVLAVGERLSKIVESDDPEYYPARPSHPEGPRAVSDDAR
jgi:hypothetical protein